jgi:hypothetical protein
VHPDLATLYQLAHAEHRAEVALGWARQRFFLAVNAALLAAGSAISAASPTAALPVLAFGAVLSLVGALVVARSHGRSRRTRGELDAAARRAGVEGPAITGGQRVLQGKARGERYRVVTLVVVALGVCGAMDACIAIRAARAERLSVQNEEALADAPPATPRSVSR